MAEGFRFGVGVKELDVSGEERSGLTVSGLLERFKAGVGKGLDNDRILLSG